MGGTESIVSQEYDDTCTCVRVVLTTDVFVIGYVDLAGCRHVSFRSSGYLIGGANRFYECR